MKKHFRRIWYTVCCTCTSCRWCVSIEPVGFGSKSAQFGVASALRRAIDLMTIKTKSSGSMWKSIMVVGTKIRWEKNVRLWYSNHYRYVNSILLLKWHQKVLKIKFNFKNCFMHSVNNVHVTWLLTGVSWPSGLAYRTQVLVLAAECGFESRPWHLCPWARHLIIIASLHPGVKWVPVRAELVD